MTAAHARSRELWERSDALLLETAVALRDRAGELVDQLRGSLAELLEKARRIKDGTRNLTLEDRYEQIHHAARHLRWATGDLAEGVPGKLWWRFDRPELVHRHFVERELERAESLPPSKQLPLRVSSSVTPGFGGYTPSP